jgi:hypothetical protein
MSGDGLALRRFGMSPLAHWLQRDIHGSGFNHHISRGYRRG